MIRVAQISDTHLSHRRSYAVPNVESILRAIAEDEPDFVVHTGDIVADDPDDAALLSSWDVGCRRLPVRVAYGAGASTCTE